MVMMMVVVVMAGCRGSTDRGSDSKWGQRGSRLYGGVIMRLRIKTGDSGAGGDFDGVGRILPSSVIVGGGVAMLKSGTRGSAFVANAVGGGRAVLRRVKGLVPSGMFGLYPFAAALNDLYVVVEYSRNDGDHVCLHYPRSDIFRSTDANVNHTLEGQVPLPHLHHIFLSPTLLQDANQPLHPAINGQDIANAGR